MFKLVIVDDEGKQTVVPLVRDEITIGRKEGNTIRLTERNVSRRHARLMKANGQFLVEDLHSYNGVKVNGQRIGAETKLEPGDQIAIGDYQLALQLDGAETSVDQHAPGVAQVDTAMLTAPGPPSRLVMITPPAPGAEFALTTERIRIGRAEDLDIWVNHRSISREHAEIQKEPDGGLRLIDLGSANGVRVNGEDVQNSLLGSGDVIELGQVRFRFVPAGEHYVFEADQTVQMDAVAYEEEEGSSRAPILVAIAIVLLAVIGAIVVAFWGSSEDTPRATQLDPDNDPVVDSADPYQANLDACSRAIRDDDYPTAIQRANDALAARPEDPQATGCLERANQLQEQYETFETGRRFHERGESEEAYNQFMSLPEGSPLRRRPLVAIVSRNFASQRLTEGELALTQGDDEEALRIANQVLAIAEITEPQRQQATSLRDRSQSDVVEEPIAVVDDPPQTGRRGGRRGPPTTGRRGGRRGTQTTGGNNGGGTATTDTSGGGSTDTSGGGGGGTTVSPEDRARECSMRGDNQCVISALEGGRARSPTALSMLIEAYRARGQSQRAMQHMRTFVQRYRSHPRAQHYQQILQIQ